MKFIFPMALLSVLFYCFTKSSDRQWCLILFRVVFSIGFCFSCPSLFKLFEWWSFFNPKVLLCRKKHPDIITKDDSTYHLPGKCYFRSFSFFQPTLFDLASFSPSKFVSFSSSASVSAQSCHQNLYHHSFSQSMCLGLTSASLMSWSLLSISRSN